MTPLSRDIREPLVRRGKGFHITDPWVLAYRQADPRVRGWLTRKALPVVNPAAVTRDMRAHLKLEG